MLALLRVTFLAVPKEAPPSRSSTLSPAAASEPVLGKLTRKVVLVASVLLSTPSLSLVLPCSCGAPGAAGARVSMAWLSLPDRSALMTALPAASRRPVPTKLSATLPEATPLLGVTTTV